MLLYDEFKQIDIRHMEPNEIITNIGTFVLPLVTAAAGWLAGRRKQKNDFLHDLQSSINRSPQRTRGCLKKSLQQTMK